MLAREQIWWLSRLVVVTRTVAATVLKALEPMLKK